MLYFPVPISPALPSGLRWVRGISVFFLSRLSSLLSTPYHHISTPRLTVGTFVSARRLATLPAEPRSTGCVDMFTYVHRCEKKRGAQPPHHRNPLSHPAERARSGVSASLPRVPLHGTSTYTQRCTPPQTRERDGRGAESTFGLDGNQGGHGISLAAGGTYDEFGAGVRCQRPRAG
jgi:hypothetical protein